MHNHHEITSDYNMTDFIDLIPFFLIIGIYIGAVYFTNKNYRKWPLYKVVLWAIGVVCIYGALFGPIAQNAHTSFQAHMVVHLLLGMLGPLLLALASPMTLLLRTLNVNYGRGISKLLKSKYVQFITHPITATILNVGGLWLLYTTNLFHAMHSSTVLFVIIHLHVFLAGYVFTISMIYMDPTPHRTSFKFRFIVLVLAMAGHGILSKWIYANPPFGIEKIDAELGGMIMYYGGDFIDLIIVIILCYQYFKVDYRVRNKKLVIVK